MLVVLSLLILCKGEGQGTTAGFYEVINEIKHFVPYDLPSYDELDFKPSPLHDEALICVTRLDELVKRLPNVDHFAQAFVIKEAVFSSAIEKIYATISDICSDYHLRRLIKVVSCYELYFCSYECS